MRTNQQRIQIIMRNLMKNQLLYLALLVSLSFSLQILHQESCDLCMQTYKRNCTICYKRCNQGKEFSSCTYTQCASYDGNNNCVSPTSQSLNQNTCLNQCCDGFAPSSIFSETNFNLCIERDSSQTDNINIGLTIGLILSLLALLFFAGLACLLVMICIDNKQKAANIPSSEGINTMRFNAKPSNDNWRTQGIPLNGMCYICNSGLSTTMANCGHHFHYSCLANTLMLTNHRTCPGCHKQSSLKSYKVYCSNCRKQYKQYTLQENQSLDCNAASTMQSIKCPNCS